MNNLAHRRAIVVLAFVAFVSLGLPDSVLGVAWPSIRAAFDRPISGIGILLGAGTCGYLLSSFFAGQIMRVWGVGLLLVASGALAGAALAGYGLTPAWICLPPVACMSGLAGGAIDSAINTFAADRFSARIVNWLHAFWGVGATVGPLVMTAVLAAQRPWRMGYLALASVLFVLALLFVLTRHWWVLGHAAEEGGVTPTARMGEALREPAVLLHAVHFFVYTGIESTGGQLLYSLFTEGRGIAPTVAGVVVGAYWAALTTGRIVFGQVAVRVRRETVVRIGLVLAPCAAALVLWAGASFLSLAGAVLLGFGLAPIFPTLISLTPLRVGPYFAPQAVGFQVGAAAVGAALFPGLVGVVARRAGLESIAVYLLVAGVTLLVLHEASRWGARQRRVAALRPAAR